MIDVYEDFLCPNCELFEKAYGNEIVAGAQRGQADRSLPLDRDPRLPHHPAGLLHARRQRGALRRARRDLPGVPPEAVRRASRPRAARASPTRSSSQFGTELGAKGDFAACVTGAKNAAAVTAETKKAVADPALQTDGQFGTPTVVANGAMVDLNNTGWLKAITG